MGPSASVDAFANSNNNTNINSYHIYNSWLLLFEKQNSDMAAYAALVSLINTKDAIMNDPRLSPCFDKEQIQALTRKLGLLLEYVEENYTRRHERDEEAECLERRIAAAAHAAEDVIESHVVDQIHAGVLEKAAAPTFFIDLHKIVHGMDLQKIGMDEDKITGRSIIDQQQMIAHGPGARRNPTCLPLPLSYERMINHIKEKVMKLKEKMQNKNKQQQEHNSNLVQYNSTPEPLGKKATMVGFDDYLNQLLDGLTCQQSHRKVIPIVGMGGIGKTTLARNAYENLLTMHHFDVRAWVSISQHYSVRKILAELISSLGQSSIDEKLEETDEGELSECLYKFLCGRRYLIILDDMWSSTVWEEIKLSFPENFSGSRIVVTTRLSEVGNDVGSSTALAIDLLDDKTSWDLFLENASITQESCPTDLEQIGKRIVKKCKGLPLSIVVMGALLGKSRVQEYWEGIAENISSILNSTQDNHQLLEVLCLSYNHLPARLKPCFLYLGIFPEDYEIHVSRLIKLWIAEGFIKADGEDKSMEEVAEVYIHDLLSRNLILAAGRLGWNRKCETFYVHDLLRDLCLREAEKENFLCIMKSSSTVEGVERERRIVIRHGDDDDHHQTQTLSSTSVARSLICEQGQPSVESKLLRVLVADYSNRSYDPTFAFKQVNMRMLAYECGRRNRYGFDKFNRGWSRSAFLLWNLQTLIVTQRTKLKAPPQIWKCRQLRHVEFWLIRLPPPPSQGDDMIVLHNLQTLIKVEDFVCSEEMCKRIPNIKRLQLYYDNMSRDELAQYGLRNVGGFNKLESLSYRFARPPNRAHLLSTLTFPAPLKELSLGRCGLRWDDIGIIGKLPNLQLLKLKWDSFLGEEWDPVEGEFLRLRYLEIGYLDLREWNADSCHFPVLDTLVLRDLSDLDGVPSGIGDIPTLRVIRAEDCSISAAVAAMKIAEEQENDGNDTLQIQLRFKHKEMKRFLQEVELQGITCRNFKLN